MTEHKKLNMKIVEAEFNIIENTGEMEYNAEVVGPFVSKESPVQNYILRIEYRTKSEEVNYTPIDSVSIFNLAYYNSWEISIDEGQSWLNYFELTNPDIKSILPTLLTLVKKDIGSIIKKYKSDLKIVGELAKDISQIEFITPEEDNQEPSPLPFDEND